MGRASPEEGRGPEGERRRIKKFLTVMKRLTPWCEPGPLERRSPPQPWTCVILGCGFIRRLPHGQGCQGERGRGRTCSLPSVEAFTPVLETSGLSRRCGRGDLQPAPICSTFPLALTILSSHGIPAEANSRGMYHFIFTQNILPGTIPTS